MMPQITKICNLRTFWPVIKLINRYRPKCPEVADFCYFGIIRPLPEGALLNLSVFLLLLLLLLFLLLLGYLIAWEGPQLLLATVRDASGRIGIFPIRFAHPSSVNRAWVKGCR